MQKPFLKWVGGKSKVVDQIAPHLTPNETLIEPFIGSGAIMLNTDYKRYIASDINPDLINLYNCIKIHRETFIQAAQALFTPANNDPEVFVTLRDRFNQEKDTFKRSVLFLYLNRHCFNGLCRYSKRNGFNVGYGKYKNVSFPEAELHAFSIKAQQATFVLRSFQHAFRGVSERTTIYSDPPYDEAFTDYTSNGFTAHHQAQLAMLSRGTNAPAFISNNDTQLTRQLYHGGKYWNVTSYRSVGAKKRSTVNEVMVAL